MAHTILYEVKCYHCGQPCEETLWADEKSFCCYGCKTVFEILNENNLCEYYSLELNPGVQSAKVNGENFAYLDENTIRKKVLIFESESLAKVSFSVPAVHCISCIWLLENLQRLDSGILRSEVNFAQKTVGIDFDPRTSSPGKIANSLARVGYPPHINLESKTETPKNSFNKTLILKLAIAGFCFGNVMLFSFPEYLGLDHRNKNLMMIFSYLNLALSVPVFFYSGIDFFRSSLTSLRQKQLSIDVPIAAGLFALFVRSAYDIISETGPGYLDSFTGLVFFLLIGRWFQGKTYESLAFDRDFAAYFPLAVNRLVKEGWLPTVVYELRRGDRILIRNMEIVPADCTLLDSEAFVDYSFVTGESRPVKVKGGDLVYAGGRLVGGAATLVVEKRISQSHLTRLWNNDIFKKAKESKYQKTIDKAARIFTGVVIFIALATGIYWQIANPSEVWLVLTSVLMVACPCALALAAPFTYGSMLRVFGRKDLYLKNADVIERMAGIDAVVFDKTGTITHGTKPEVNVCGVFDEKTLGAIRLLTGSSSHPLSTIVSKAITAPRATQVSDFKELPGKGIEGVIDGQRFRIGSPDFVGAHVKQEAGCSVVCVAVDDDVLGYFSIRTMIRENIQAMVHRLEGKYVALLSGDNSTDVAKMKTIFGGSTPMLFNQDPHDKLAFIKSLQADGKRVLMVGDGLNDAGALKQSDVGIAVTDDTGLFTPACDGILKGKNLGDLDKYLALAKASSTILRTGFAISFFYNAIALTFAVTGYLTPLVAAILMPISSISVVGFSSISVNMLSRIGFRQRDNTKQN